MMVSLHAPSHLLLLRVGQCRSSTSPTSHNVRLMQSVVIDIVVRCQNVGSVKDSRVRADCGTYYSTIDAAFVFPVSVRSGVGEVPERETK
ncbi:hypothetical protein BC629DRAFT_1537717, partial [Irpex lacteus]